MMLPLAANMAAGQDAPPPPAASDDLSALAALPQEDKVRKHEVSVSGDFFLGEGNVSVPFGFSLAQSLNQIPGVNVAGTVNDADRSSTYFGGTLSYSYGQGWYFDLGFAQGSSSGEVPVSLSGDPIYEQLPAAFDIDDTWYQAYVRYTFPGLRGKRFSAYLRAGVTFVQADLTMVAPIPNFGLYRQEDETQDILGNIGFGVGYSLYATRRVRIGLQAEVEGSYGTRTQDVTEFMDNDLGLVLEPASLDNTLYGGVGRGTVRFDYRANQANTLKLFADVGFQARFTIIEYPSGLGTFDELLWGPYAKVGLRYSF
jgi:hypothetical protein